MVWEMIFFAITQGFQQQLLSKRLKKRKKNNNRERVKECDLVKIAYKAVFFLTEQGYEDECEIGVYVPALPGIISGGNSIDDAYMRVQEAIVMALEDYETYPEDVPLESIQFENIEGEVERIFYIEFDTELVDFDKKVDVTVKIPANLYSQAENYHVDYAQVFEDTLQRMIDQVELGADMV